MTQTGNEKFLADAWRTRDALYQELFGPHTYCLPKLYAPPAAPAPGFALAVDGHPSEGTFASAMSQQKITVLSYAPAENRPYWMYLTAGLSNPWFQDHPDEVSGFGCELMIKCNKDSRWPVRMLKRLSYYILSYSGTLSPGVILSMESPLTVNNKASLNNIFVWYADEAPDCWYQLPSGGFGIFCTIGITEDECRFAESIDEYGTWCIQQVLRQTGTAQVTDPERSSVMEKEGIGSILQSVRAYAENFRLISH